MGYSDDVMHDFIRKDVTRLFSPADGWTAEDYQFQDGRNRGLLLSRRSPTRGGLESIIILISFEQKTGTDVIRSLQEERLERRFQGVSRVLMVPQGADTSLVPRDIMVIPMHSFAFEGKNLIWIHKNRHNPHPERTAMS